ncbi:hypothetical protein F383_00317 [Gossypium arboreum]|uniref:Uncharacterized protein n=1 Tax=Gossypium arboreum TaxID=29729 RepID=A0A0B0NSH3_GOSAR|nr:hypothetical protein F383_00317 [Gossypium arboreum]
MITSFSPLLYRG